MFASTKVLTASGELSPVLSVSIVNVVDHGMDVMAAVSAPRIHHQWMPDRLDIERGGVSEAVLSKLKAMGHNARFAGTQGDAHTIWIGPDGTPYGVNDKRSADSKASVPSRLTAPTGGR